MQAITFAPGNGVMLMGKEHTVVGVSDNDRVHLRTADNIEKTLTLQTLLGHHLSGNLGACPRRKERGKRLHEKEHRQVKLVAHHSDIAIQRGFQAREILKSLDQAGVRLRDDDENFKRIVKAAAEQVGLKKPPCARTLLRWRDKSYFSNQHASTLIPRFDARGGKGRCRASEEIQLQMDDVVFNEYMTTEKICAQKCFEKLCANIAKLNESRPKADQLRPPSLNTFKRWINSKPAYDLYASRHGKDAADLKFRSSGRNPEQWGFMECVEVDHTVLDLMVVDPERGLVLGRPRITLFIEWSTRACVGFTVGFEGTSTQTVLECLRSAVSLKDYVREAYDKVKNDWPCWGFPRYLKLDNGPEFHSVTFRETMAALGIDLIYCPRKKPWFKGRVERVIKRLNTDLMATLPGATLTQLYNRVTGNDPSEYAVIDLQTLRHILHIWVVDVYHQEKHRGIRTTPHKAWKQAFDLTQVALPSDMHLLDVLCSETEVRTIFHYGIEICGERTFNNPALQEIRRLRQFDDYIKVKVRYRPAKLDKIWVYDDAMETWIEVMNSNPATRDLSEFQLSLIHKMQREEDAKGNALSIAEARQRMKSMVEPLLRAKTQRARKKALKLLGWTTDIEVLSPKKSQQPQIAMEEDDSREESPTAKSKTSSIKKKLPKQDVRNPKSDPESLPTLGAFPPSVPATESGRKAIYEGELPAFPITGVRSATPSWRSV